MSLESSQDTARDLYDYLKHQGAVLRNDDGRLIVNAPENTITDEIAARIRTAKPALLRLIALDDDVIEPADRSGPLPLGLVQERMWAHATLEPDSLLYYLPMAWRLEGELDVALLVRAFDQFVDNHEVLRLQIKTRDGVPCQLFQAPPLELGLIDLSGIADPDERSAELESQVETVRRQRFDFEEGPLMLARLFILGPASHVIFLMPHHLVWDAWCYDVFLEQVNAIYTGMQGDIPAGGDIPGADDVQFADYALWHRERTEHGYWQADFDYWAETLQPLPDPLALPTDLPRPRIFDHEGDWVTFKFDGEGLAALRRLATAHRTTPSTIMLTIWQAFLARISGNDDLVIGMPVLSRTHQTADAIGCFVNTIFLRAVIDVTRPLNELAEQTKQQMFEALEHQNAPVNLLAEHIVADRDLSRTPISQVMFSHQQISARPKGIGEARIAPHYVNLRSAPADVMLAIIEGVDAAAVNLHYATRLFSRPQIETIEASFKTFLNAALTAPEMAMDQHALIEDEAFRSLSQTINDTAAAYPRDKTVDQLIADHVDSTPDKIAVRLDDREMSYRELWVRSAEIAGHLANQDLPADAIIGVMMDRTPDMVAAILGIWRAGAAYLPLDSLMPEARLQFMMDDAGVALVLTDDVSMPERHDGPQRFQDVALIADTEAPDSIERSAADRAYVLYTSGSTGQPKGVVNSHRMAVNFLCSMMKAPGLSSDDRLLAITTLSFDISILELFGPLAAGGTVILCAAEDTADGFYLSDLLDEHDITVMQATPVSWQLLLDSDWSGRPGLKALCGGEALPSNLVQDLLSKVGELWNMYGPTETTVWSTCRQITGEEEISVGRPIDNTQIYVLDAKMCPLPRGIAGEVWIGGDGVADGYLGREALTRERFVHDPFSEDSTARLYRTGDVGRILPNGDLVILGRQDHQVKLRGYRIELGDIEAALETHPAIARAVAAIPTDPSGEPVLTAYTVLAEAVEITNSELRQWLRHRLPAYMIPQAIVTLDTMPLTANGKVDRKALPLPDIAVPAARERIPPRDETEQALADIWGEILSVGDISINDNFFELGGQSLQAAQMVARMRQRAGRKISPRSVIFETLGQLAAGSTAV